jgi:hypothetical protein
MRGNAIVIIEHVKIAAARLAYVLDLANAETPRALNAFESNSIAHKKKGSGVMGQGSGLSAI